MVAVLPRAPANSDRSSRSSIVTQSDPAADSRASSTQRGVSSDDFVITRADPGRSGPTSRQPMSGISLVRPCLSKISSSPTKIGEYLAAGLPVVSTAGIGDVDGLLDSNGVGVLLRETDATSCPPAPSRSSNCLPTPRRESGAGGRPRKLSLADVGIPRYDRLYRAVARTRPGQMNDAGRDGSGAALVLGKGRWLAGNRGAGFIGAHVATALSSAGTKSWCSTT